MSMWTYINGTITVDAIGRTQAEKEYILRTVLDHLPLVTGSEEGMGVYLIQANGYDYSSSVDEFKNRSNQLVDSYGAHNQKYGRFKTQSEYIIVVDGALRDRMFDTTFAEFNKWLCRLAKRALIDKVLVELTGGTRHMYLTTTAVFTEICLRIHRGAASMMTANLLGGNTCTGSQIQSGFQDSWLTNITLIPITTSVSRIG